MMWSPRVNGCGRAKVVAQGRTHVDTLDSNRPLRFDSHPCACMKQQLLPNVFLDAASPSTKIARRGQRHFMRGKAKGAPLPFTCKTSPTDFLQNYEMTEIVWRCFNCYNEKDFANQTLTKALLPIHLA